MNADKEKLAELRAAVKHAMAALQSMGDTEEGVSCAYSGLRVALDQTAAEPLLITPSDRIDRIERDLAALRGSLA
jgi:hypothetical protein